MQRTFILIAALMVLQSTPLFAQKPTNAVADKPLASSNGVEIQSIRLLRRSSVGTDTQTQQSNLEMEFWLTKPTAGDVNKHTLRFLELAPIIDDLGNLLTTPKRLDAVPYLKGEMSTVLTKQAGGKSGPVVSMTLDAPARNATRISLIQGKAELKTESFTRLKFDDVAALDGKKLEHEKLVGFTIVPKVAFEDGQTIITLRVPKDHSKIAEWGLGDKTRLLTTLTNTTATDEDSVIFTKTYKGDRRKNTFLGVMLAEPIVKTNYDFKFKDLELP